MALITRDEKTNTLQIGMDLLNKVQIRNGNRTALQPNQELRLSDTGRTEEVNGELFPVLNMGNGQTINLHSLANFYVADEKFETSIQNKGEKEECLARNAQVTTLKDFMVANEGKLPASLKVVSRVKDGAQKEFLADADKGAMRAQGYKLLEIDTTKEHFPVIWSRKGDDPKKVESWKHFERIAVQANA